MIGFTGTQKGMTRQQKNVLKKLLSEINIELNQISKVLHHGDCIGADKEACEIALDLGFELHCHPPINSNKRAFVKSKYVEKEKSYLDRNHDIVNSSYILYATPFEMEEVLRSGTWATIRYARKQNKKITIIFPDGNFS